MPTILLEMYERGDITADHLAVQCLHLLDPENPAAVLAALPGQVLDRVLAYSRSYRPDGMRSNYGVTPAVDQVLAAKGWIEAQRRQSA
ncbi:MAG: hypothetical protein U0736_00050 [Gemmataceae bacterium]